MREKEDVKVTSEKKTAFTTCFHQGKEILNYFENNSLLDMISSEVNILKKVMQGVFHIKYYV